MVSRHTRTKGRVVESAGMNLLGSVQARTVGITAPGVVGGRQGTDPLPALERSP